MLVTVGFGLGACDRGAVRGNNGPTDAGTDGDGAQVDSPPPSPSLDAASDVPPPAPEGGADLGGAPADAGAEGPPPERDLSQFIAALNDAFYGRWSVCFGTPRDLWPSGDFSDLPLPALQESVRLGLLTIDPEAAQHCFQALMTASCDRLVDLRGPLGPRNIGLPECAGAFVSHVPPGKTCLSNDDCQSPEQYACVGNRVCGRVCTARPARAAGDVCSEGTDRCPDGTVCRFGPNNIHDQRCLGPTPQGEACRESDACGPGLLCAEATATSVFDGTCRSSALGSPCAGNWECAYSYVCAGAGPNQAGTCQVGKPVGATCTTYLEDVNHSAYSDCAPLTYCLDLDGTGPRCTDRAPLGDRCGIQTGRYPGWVGCLEGYCAPDPGSSPTVSTCEPTKLAGAACANDLECGRPNRCLTGADGGRQCGPPNAPAPIGSPCDLGGVSCGAGEYCALPANFDPNSLFIPSMGICAAVIRPGQSCRPRIDACEGLAECVEGVCKRCP